MNPPVDFEWDDAKANANIAKHGVPFAFAARVFLDTDAAVIASIRPEDGEDRYKAVGRIEGKLYVVVFVMRGRTCRLISARRTNAKEERIYGHR
jgi:uncharacterized DUF497 family protein